MESYTSNLKSKIIKNDDNKFLLVGCVLHCLKSKDLDLIAIIFFYDFTLKRKLVE